MMQITEDTPPDMLAGAMDLTVHLPNGSSVKMSVERSTPMMDLLVQITTANHLQLSSHTLQALGMAPSSEHSDRILPFKPNTPIGALDTQHIRVLPKGKTLPAPKYTAPGHQPFESTFRLKVHLPRNQLYVTRVSRNVLLEDIMKKVCEEKNLDPVKYEFKHPGNLDQVLDPKLTLSDYQITEIYVVIKGTTNLNQAFSAADIMVLRKEEERKQMHNKTGGGVFNLIFKRGKSSMGSGSVSSDNRSISPTHSDDSRSVTPPAVQAPPIVSPPKKDPPPDRPKPPLRKRRPAPKPPQIQIANASNDNDVEKSSSVVSNEEPSHLSSQKSSENGLTICHSRNSSDSSGYHEASILSDHCANTSLPRTRPKSAFVGEQVALQSTSNLSKMSLHSRSTTSLVAGRKKKAAPPPPPVPVSPANSVVAQSEKPSPLVASQSDISTHQESSEVLETTLTPIINPVPLPRSRTKIAPKAPPRRPSSEIFTLNKELLPTASSNRLSYNEDIAKIERRIEKKLGIKEDESKEALNKNIIENVLKETLEERDKIESKENIKSKELDHSSIEVELRRSKKDINISTYSEKTTQISNTNSQVVTKKTETNKMEFHLGSAEGSSDTFRGTKESLTISQTPNEDFSVEEMLTSLEITRPFVEDKDTLENTKSANVLTHQEEKDLKSSPKTTIINAQKSVISNIFTSDEFLKESKPPEIVGVIPKTPKQDKKFVANLGTFGKKRSFQLGNAFFDSNYDPETASISSKRSGESKSSRNSVASALNALDDEISDLDENMFTGSLSKGSTKKRPEVFNQLFGMHDYDSEVSKMPLKRNISVGSLRSVSSVPGLNGSRIQKWDNSEELDSVSLSSYGIRNKWVAGDFSDTESIASSNLTPAQTPFSTVPPCPLESSTPVKAQPEEKSLESTDSGIAQDTHFHREEEFGFYTPPPPPILDDIQPEDISSTEINLEPTSTLKLPISPKTELSVETNLSKLVSIPPVLNTSTILRQESPSTTDSEIVVKLGESSKPKIDIPPPPITSPPRVENTKKETLALPQNAAKETEPEPELVDIDWQYQLPSPPKAFRDSSPAHLTIHETNSVTDFKDSVVTSPELFEKLRSLDDHQSDKDTFKSEVTSIASEEPLNMLSLEHLEKRKSLVYNRELATSLKMTDSLETSNKNTNNFTSSTTSFPTSTFDKVDNVAMQQKQPPKPARTTTLTSLQHHTLPNFKITTYDVPKQNITVFEDDTIRSNTHLASNLTKREFGRSMENMSFVKSSVDNESSIKKEKEYTFYKPASSNPRSVSTMARSGSFSTDHRLPIKPVSRSKSTLTLNKHPVGKMNETSISRSNSLFDVSGLQSLELMKLIQNKLKTPTGSMENISYKEKPQSQYVPPSPPPIIAIPEKEPLKGPEPQPIEEEKPKPQSPQPVKKYYYRGPPAVNMTTWSERPKVPVSVKEDEDYKLGNVNMSSKLIVNTNNNNITSNNSIEVKSNGFVSHQKGSDSKNVIVNVNGTEQISQQSNNVVIKIGSTHNNNYIKNIENQRFVGPTAYRKPFSNITRNGNSLTQRPHSIALPSDFDISRVPVVRSVEFKKPYKDFHGSNTSITHLNHDGDEFRSLHHNLDKSESFAEKFRSTENLRSIEKQESEPNKRVFRVGSFKPLENHAPPVVRGFKSNADVNHRLSWNPSSTYNTLPAKPKEEKEYITNQHVPFSQSTLKRTASSKIYTADQNFNDISKPTFTKEKSPMEHNTYNSLPPNLTNNKLKVTPSVAPPPPPQMPSVTLRKVIPQELKGPRSSDPRDLLLDSIRNFGGKKGLKAVKA